MFESVKLCDRDADSRGSELHDDLKETANACKWLKNQEFRKEEECFTPIDRP